MTKHIEYDTRKPRIRWARAGQFISDNRTRNQHGELLRGNLVHRLGTGQTGQFAWD